MQAMRKITIFVSEELLDKAQKCTGEGVTPTVRQGLTLVAAGDTYDRLRRLRGKVKTSLSVQELREDRDA